MLAAPRHDVSGRNLVGGGVPMSVAVVPPEHNVAPARPQVGVVR